MHKSYAAHSPTAADPSQEKCTHKMSEIPRWISTSRCRVELSKSRARVSTASLLTSPFACSFDAGSKKVEIVRTLLSEDPAMLLRETLGISADGSEKVYRDDDITAFEEREAQRLVWIDRDHRLNVMHFFVAVDPSGGGASAFSICSALTMPNGAIQVRCFLLLGPILYHHRLFRHAKLLAAP